MASTTGADDWIEQFLAYTADGPSPDAFRLWGAISCLAGVLERKVWIRMSRMETFANMFIILVGPPSAGKGYTTNKVEELWRSVRDTARGTDVHVAPKSMSFASLGDVLRDSVRRIVRVGAIPPYVEFNSLIIHSREMKVLLPEYSSQMLDRLTDLWDGQVWDERLRGGGVNYVIEKPQVHLLAGETPSWFNNVIPDNAWEGGFLSRTILVWGGQQKRLDPFFEGADESALHQRLVKGLRDKNLLYGKMEFTAEAAEAFKTWYMAGGEPAPDHPKLRHYLGRRHQHLAKVMMVSSISRSNSLLIEKYDFDRSLDWLMFAESQMDEIFKASATTGDASVIDEAWRMMYSQYVKTKKPIPATILSRFISARVPAFHVGKLIEVMEQGGYVKKAMEGGEWCYTPFKKVD